MLRPRLGDKELAETGTDLDSVPASQRLYDGEPIDDISEAVSTAVGEVEIESDEE